MARVTSHEFNKTQLNLKVSLHIDDQLTWAELFRFADLARSGGYTGEQKVVIEYDPYDSDQRVVGLTIHLSPDEVEAVATTDDADRTRSTCDPAD